MNNDELPGILKVSIVIAKVVLCLLLVLIAGIFIYFGVIEKTDIVKSEPLEFIESWTVSDSDGNEFVSGRSCVAEKDYTDETIIQATLPRVIKDNEYLFFETRKDTAVYINNNLRKDFVEERDVKIPGGSLKKFIMMVPLNCADSGAEVKIVRFSILKDDKIVPETFISTRSGAVNYLIKMEGLSLILSTIVLIFSIVVFIVSLVLSFCYKMKINMTYGALGICIISLWIITDSFLCPFIFGVYHVNGILNYILSLMIPFGLAIYLNSIQRGRYKIFMSVIMIVSSINAVGWTVLNFAGLLPYYYMRSIENTILVSMALLSMGALIFDAIKNNNKEYRYTLIGFFGFLVSGTIELLLILLTPIYNSIPMVVGLGFLLTFIVIQQVNDLRKINIEKQKAIDISEAKSRFLASMSHEIRTPINAILGMNEMILRENNDKVIGEYSRSIKTSGKMLLMLVNDVLDFSKIEAGKLEINEIRFRMSETLGDVISLIKERIEEKKLDFKLEIKGNIPNELITDEFRLRQVLVNLLGNAVKYTDKGTVTLELSGNYSEEEFELIIVVRDTGKGIPKEEQAGLFEAFTRADVKTNISIEGTGLGLTIVKHIVDSMKGTIDVDSEYGKGSEFRVMLPVKYAGEELLKSENVGSGLKISESQEPCDFTAPYARILAVDDNQSNLTIVKLFLKRTGILTDLCNNGNRAVELCRENKYDLILLDHMMPQPDGIETLHIIRVDEKSLNKDTKAVVLTANAVAGSRQMYIDEGFEEYLTKPLDSKVLEQTVKNLLPRNKVFGNTPKTDISPVRDESQAISPIKRKLTSIEGLDYEAALKYCGGDEGILEEITSDIAADCSKRTVRMRESLKANDLKAYSIDAHSIKSNMATIGLKDLSERAKKHELAAKNNDFEFVTKDAEEFLASYTEICKRLE